MDSNIVVDKKQIVDELILILEDFDDMDIDEIDINYYPWIDSIEKKNNPIYEKYRFITLKDIIHNQKLTEEFCDYYYNVCSDGHEWHYECINEDMYGFLNVIPPYISTCNHLVNLTIMYSEISKIENLPPNITNLKLGCNKIEKIENLPANIENLDLSENKIEKIENIPSKVKYLDLSCNKITKIENIPKGVEKLKMTQNKINKLENLPDNIEELFLQYDKITEVGNLNNLVNNIEILISNQNIDITKISKNITLNLLYDHQSNEIKKYADEVNLKYNVFRNFKYLLNFSRLLKKYSIYEEDDDDTNIKLIKLYNCLIIKDFMYDGDKRKNEEELEFRINSSKKFIEDLIDKNRNNEVYEYIMEEVVDIIFNIKNLGQKIVFNYKYTNFLRPRKLVKNYILEYKSYNIYESKLYSFFLELLKSENYIFSKNKFYENGPEDFIFEKNKEKNKEDDSEDIYINDKMFGYVDDY